MELSPTARVLLGLIRLGKRNGYEIKQLVDISTRFFWAASYGQIYPELRRLEEQGVIRGKEAGTNGRAPAQFEHPPARDEAVVCLSRRPARAATGCRGLGRGRWSR